jgi:hypothetical protein
MNSLQFFRTLVVGLFVVFGGAAVNAASLLDSIRNQDLRIRNLFENFSGGLVTADEAEALLLEQIDEMEKEGRIGLSESERSMLAENIAAEFHDGITGK